MPSLVHPPSGRKPAGNLRIRLEKREEISDIHIHRTFQERKQSERIKRESVATGKRTEAGSSIDFRCDVLGDGYLPKLIEQPKLCGAGNWCRQLLGLTAGG